MLFVSQNPIVKINAFFGKSMRFFDGFNDSDSRRFAVPEFLNSVRQSLRRRTVSAACI